MVVSREEQDRIHRDLQDVRLTEHWVTRVAAPKPKPRLLSPAWPSTSPSTVTPTADPNYASTTPIVLGHKPQEGGPDDRLLLSAISNMGMQAQDTQSTLESVPAPAPGLVEPIGPHGLDRTTFVAETDMDWTGPD
ncbi:hypothetical protein F5888DRAFT_1639860 [Russula emetica]|nr:hypothetical protein F5888DRAFT_1639860 [Russula emetica]